MYRLCAGSEACHDQTTRLTLWRARAPEILPAMHRSLGEVRAASASLILPAVCVLSRWCLHACPLALMCGRVLEQRRILA